MWVGILRPSCRILHYTCTWVYMEHSQFHKEKLVPNVTNTRIRMHADIIFIHTHIIHASNIYMCNLITYNQYEHSGKCFMLMGMQVRHQITNYAMLDQKFLTSYIKIVNIAKIRLMCRQVLYIMLDYIRLLCVMVLINFSGSTKIGIWGWNKDHG